MFNIIPVQFTSSWNEGEVETAAKLDLHTGEVFDIELSDDGGEYQGLKSEYVTVGDGKINAVVEVGSDDVYRIATGNELAAIRSQFTFVQ